MNFDTAFLKLRKIRALITKLKYTCKYGSVEQIIPFSEFFFCVTNFNIKTQKIGKLCDFMNYGTYLKHYI